ncbi:isopenicillin-N N-acyltransferase [Phyllosticta citribraziliensis]|uniref:Isopenicillin-N N-acyltransferase n=1 Tax=Phyllosticta citribraziliensis TaxID=989973 RepID=A0ABR1LHP8_9PEZI
MLRIHCEGTPYEIGYTHGSKAAESVRGSLKFYASMFQETAKLSWSEVRETALEFLPYIEENCPDFVEEMRGIADGTGNGTTLADIVALNVRTEIAFGLFSDGCTMLAWHTAGASGNKKAFIAQNWDWRAAQSGNLVCLTVKAPGKPVLHTLTEAGLLAKVGFNSNGVGVTLNAIRALGVSRNRLPTHLALRTALESRSVAGFRATLDSLGGCAAACTIGVADRDEAVSLECSAFDIVALRPESLKAGSSSFLAHTNHYVLPHAQGVAEIPYLEDSRPRLARVRELCEGLAWGRQEPTVNGLRVVFGDEKGRPFAINRGGDKEGDVLRNTEGSVTLFNVIMDLVARRAWVKVGRPTEGGDDFELGFE